MSVRAWLLAPPAAPGPRSRLGVALMLVAAAVGGMCLLAILVAVLYRAGVLYPCPGREICSR